ncbi:hypothetical protein ZHAS_00016181 [Anopheles sinensis]|uniref:Uncharacterized protein n=1 Tax=Anopheles sinensis TaxID=74873 RepID=A0A084WCW4_ANOSI|nr:hypothetical protein ZHAS_00016181 [Anopheles sinensis]
MKARRLPTTPTPMGNVNNPNGRIPTHSLPVDEVPGCIVFPRPMCFGHVLLLHSRYGSSFRIWPSVTIVHFSGSLSFSTMAPRLQLLGMRANEQQYENGNGFPGYGAKAPS